MEIPICRADAPGGFGFCSISHTVFFEIVLSNMQVEYSPLPSRTAPGRNTWDYRIVLRLRKELKGLKETAT